VLPTSLFVFWISGNCDITNTDIIIKSDRMSDKKIGISGLDRRNVLKGVAGAAGAAGVTGLAFGGSTSAQSDVSESEEEDTEDETNRWNIQYTSEQGKDQAEEAAEEIYHDLNPIDILTIESTPDEVQELQDSSEIGFIREDRKSQTEYIRNDQGGESAQEQPSADGQIIPWGIDRIGAPLAHEEGITGDGANVVIIDSGINATHEDLEGNLGEGAAYVECQGDCTEPWDDDRGHGTHVAGVAGAIDNEIGVVGASPDVTLHAIKATQGGIGFNSDLAGGIVWAALQGYDVANMSFGDPSLDPVIEAAVDFAHNEGVLLVASAMNVGGPVWYPAALPEVIAVSATSQDDTLADFSNRGPEIDLAAPGVDILSTIAPNVDLNPTSALYMEGSGTSAAAPHVSGVGALLMAQGFTAEEARQFMESTAEDIGLPPEEQGSGLVNAAAVIDPDDPDPDDPDEKKKDCKDVKKKDKKKRDERREEEKADKKKQKA
jgi:subtilisin